MRPIKGRTILYDDVRWEIFHIDDLGYAYTLQQNSEQHVKTFSPDDLKLIPEEAVKYEHPQLGICKVTKRDQFVVHLITAENDAFSVPTEKFRLEFLPVFR